MLIHFDSGRRDWLERRRPILGLFGAINGATGRVPMVSGREFTTHSCDRPAASVRTTFLGEAKMRRVLGGGLT